LPILAGAAAFCAALLALSTNVASSLVPQEWTQHHATLVGVVTGVLVLISVWLTALVMRHGSSRQETPVVDGSVRVKQSSAPLVIAHSGVTVQVGSSGATSAPVPRPGQIVVGELPGAPPAFVAREAVDRLTAVFAAGERVAAVSALTGGRGAGKTQVAAQYAREAVADGVELVAWVSAVDQNRLLAGLAEVAQSLGVTDPEGDSETSAKRLRDTLAVRTTPGVMVLDNASDPEAVRRYLPTTGATRVIITSTDRAFASLGSEIDVGVFDRPQSIAYLSQRTGLTDDSGANAVSEELGSLPLALAQAATVIKLHDLTYEVYLERLRSLPLDEMLPADRGSDYPHGVARAVVLSVEAVQDADPTGLTSRALATVAVLDASGVIRDVLAEIVGSNVGSGQYLDDALAHLVEFSLMVWAKDRHAVVMHRLVARAIRDQLQTNGDLSACLTAVSNGLRGLLPAEEQAWEHRQDGVEIVGQAIGLWENAVSATERDALTQDDLDFHAYLAHWAVRHLRATADLSRSIEIGTSVLAACERVLGPDHPDTLVSRNNLASAYESAGDLDKAIPLFEETFAACERVFGHNHPDTLASRSNLASAYRSAGDLDRAIPLLEETLATCERILGSDHSNTLTFRNNLAGAYRSAGDLDRAIPLLEETLAARKRVLGPDHPDTLASGNNLAGAYRSAEDLDKAIPLIEDTFAAYERVLGLDHPDTLKSRNNLAGAYKSAGSLDKAIPLFEDNLAACERVLGSDHPDTLTSSNNLAMAYESSGDLARAIPLLKDTLTARERVLGPDHPDTLTSSNNLAMAYESSGDLARAIPLLEDTFTACERVLGPDHPNTLTSRSNLAGAYQSAGDLDRAIPVFEETLAASERVLGPDHSLTKLIRSNLNGVLPA
jgi:tetratricopeptide (TPR) repeat protein